MALFESVEHAATQRNDSPCIEHYVCKNCGQSHLTENHKCGYCRSNDHVGKNCPDRHKNCRYCGRDKSECKDCQRLIKRCRYCRLTDHSTINCTNKDIKIRCGIEGCLKKHLPEEHKCGICNGQDHIDKNCPDKCTVVGCDSMFHKNGEHSCTICRKWPVNHLEKDCSMAKNTVCPICLEQINEKSVAIYNCTHLVCYECVISWRKSRGKTCPYCRASQK